LKAHDHSDRFNDMLLHDSPVILPVAGCHAMFLFKEEDLNPGVSIAYREDPFQCLAEPVSNFHNPFLKSIHP
jgi:hypothetical protein